MIFEREEKIDFIEKGGFKVDASMKLDGLDDSFTTIPPAENMIVFLRQHIGLENVPLVDKGDTVEYGQKIGDINKSDKEGAKTTPPLAVPVHSPVDGKVVEMKKMRNPLSGEVENAIIIETTSESTNNPYDPMDPKTSSKEELLKRVREAGIVGLGGAAFPTYAKLSQKNISTLIINAKESDPNIACDFRLMLEKPKEMVSGIKLMAKILEAERIIYATRTKQGETPELTKLLGQNSIEIVRIRPCYSLGSENLLVKEVLGKEVPSGKYPPSVGVLVHNVFTAYAVSRAIEEGEPLISRGITLYSPKTGAKNFWVRMGTPIEHILKFSGIRHENLSRVLLGSLFMGQAIPDPSYPILKATSAVTAFTKENPDPYESPLPCIRCGYCNSVCPVDIYPQLIMEAEKKKDAERLKKLHVEVCIDCGLCSYVCPSRIRFTKYLSGGKKRIRQL
ncbi:MAG: putative Electron transport complex subunit C [Promethearchaeota archaeon]|nr:MAG: putative Electron transport complex subunit C [Candidatus Lokiarchaeota archaeon]